MPVVDKLSKSILGSRERIVEMASLLAFFIPSVTDPTVYMFAVKHNKNLSQDQKKMMTHQNWTHHLFNLSIEVTSLLAARPLIGYLCKNGLTLGGRVILKKHPEEVAKFYKSIVGFAGLIIAKSLIRPFVMIHFAEAEKLKEKKMQAERQSNTATLSVMTTSAFVSSTGNYLPLPKPSVSPFHLSPSRRYCQLYER